MNETIVLGLGYLVLIILGLFLIWIIFIMIYYLVDYTLKKILGWENPQTREDIIYFIKHRDEIQDYIRKNKGVKNE